ncbi:MAG: DNA replication/repair protein RecF [Candidatus Tumulicola sp.]
MQLIRLALSDFRNYAELAIEPAPGLNVFVGANAQGKSNLLEAIAILGTGKSFRTTRDVDTVRYGADAAAVSGEALVRAGTINLACTVAKGGRSTRKTYTLNGRGVRYSNFLGKLRVVTFVPSDLQMAGGPPSLRRAFLNAGLSQEDPRYYRDLVRYRKALQQKNALLRAAESPDPELLSVYERELVEAGTQIVFARHGFVSKLAVAARAAHARFARGNERLDVEYESNVTFESATPQAVTEAFESRLRQVADSERARKTAVAGPHRDDLRLTLDERSLAAYGSQGQQRTAVLALKVAEYVVLRDSALEAPLLLLDDVLSELDEERAAAFLGGVGDYEQAFVTATHMPAALPDGAHVHLVRAARVAAGSAAC